MLSSCLSFYLPSVNIEVCALFVPHPPISECTQPLAQTWLEKHVIFVAHSQLVLLLPVTSQQNSLSFHQHRGRNAQLSRRPEVKAEQFPSSQGVSYHCLSAYQDNKNLYSSCTQLAPGLSLHSDIRLSFPMLDITLPRGKVLSKQSALWSQKELVHSCSPLLLQLSGTSCTFLSSLTGRHKGEEHHQQLSFILRQNLLSPPHVPCPILPWITAHLA